nr:ECF transporter S component [Candidatus Formimonas warabiya]
METFTIRHLTFSYPEQTRDALYDVTLSIGQGQFVTLCGPSGCGKTTLLRQLKTVLAPHGRREGEILFEGTALEEIDQRTQASRVGFVMQSPDNQIVTDKVWHELAFGLESLGCDTPTIRLRVAEMASFFGIQTWFYKNVTELSGGQKQLLNLAAVMAMQPAVLILDEPTSQLDPIAAGDFLAAVSKVNRELGITVIMTEHRLEQALPLSDRVVVLDGGRILADGAPKEAATLLKERHHGMFLAMPAPMRIYAGVENNLACPVTVREGRAWLNKLAETREIHPIDTVQKEPASEGLTPALELSEVWFRYEKNAPDVVKGLSMQAYPGELYAIVGGNGTGKTTALSLVSGVNRPHRGKVFLQGRELSRISDGEKFNGLLGVLPQNPQALFVKKTVEMDLYEMFSGRRISKDEQGKRVAEVSRLCQLDDLLKMHPYDLSGGEQQRAALAKVLLLEPQILLLDEPTKGMDGYFKQKFAGILKNLQGRGVAIVMVSHDTEFCAEYADRCAMFFDGNIVTAGAPRAFFSGNSFYTTSANRMARHLVPGAVTVADVITACAGRTEKPQVEELKEPMWQQKKEPPVQEKTVEAPAPAKHPLWRKLLALATLIALAATAVYTVKQSVALLKSMVDVDVLASLPAPADSGANIWRYALLLLLLAAEVVLLFTMLSARKRSPYHEPVEEQVRPENRYLSRRTLAAMAMILVAIPLTVFIGFYYLGDRKYYFISLLIILETMLPFVMVFESRKPQARELIIIAVLCAIGVAGRAAFFMLPQFKPVVAIVIIAGVAFGGEAGFLVGAVTGFASNMFFGQGPWTPWQMFAFGIIGFLAGVLFRKGLLRRGRGALCIFGGFATFLIYGGIMNSAAVFMFQAKPTTEMFYLTYLQGIPFDLVHATATVFFLWLISQPMLEKLDRIKVKYGLIESGEVDTTAGNLSVNS